MQEPGVEKPSPPLISPPPAPPSISPSPPAPPSAPPPSAPSAPPTTPAAPPSLPSSLPPSRLSQRAADIFSFFVDTTEKTKEVARQVLVEEDELLDRKQREESVRNWSKDQQSKLEEGLKQFSGKGELTPQEWDEIAMNIQGKTGVECFDRYSFVVAALKKQRPLVPSAPPPVPAPQRTSGITGLLSSLFGTQQSPIFQEPLERASNASSLATFSSVAPTVMDGTGASELWKAALLGSPVIAGGRLVSSEVLFRALFSDAAALAHVCNQPEGSRSLAPTFADELAAKVDHMPRAVVLPANSSARDVLARFAAENCSHVLIGGFGEPNRVARTVSRSEALRFVHSVSPVPTRRRSALEVSVLPDEMVVSVLRLLLLSRDPVVCGETVVSWDVVDAAGVAKVASMMKKPIGALLASVGADLPLQTVLKNLQL